MSINIPSIVNLLDVNRSDFVEQVYAVILGRQPDESGIETFETMLGSGGSAKRRKIILAIARSSEARARSALAPMIAMEALRMRRWRFLPWNRSAIAIAASQSELHTSVEAVVRSVEQKIVSFEQRFSAVEAEFGSMKPGLSGERPAAKNDERTLALIEHIMRSLKGLSFTLGKIEGTLKR